MEFLFLLAGFVVVFFSTAVAFARRYKRCPSDKVLVVYGKISGGDKGLSARCYHGGASFVWPIIQDYQFLDLTPTPAPSSALTRARVVGRSSRPYADLPTVCVRAWV